MYIAAFHYGVGALLQFSHLPQYWLQLLAILLATPRGSYCSLWDHAPKSWTERLPKHFAQKYNGSHTQKVQGFTFSNITCTYSLTESVFTRQQIWGDGDQWFPKWNGLVHQGPWRTSPLVSSSLLSHVQVQWNAIVPTHSSFVYINNLFSKIRFLFWPQVKMP